MSGRSLKGRAKGRAGADGRRRRAAEPQRPESQAAEKGRRARAAAMAEEQRPRAEVPRRPGEASE